MPHPEGNSHWYRYMHFKQGSIIKIDDRVIRCQSPVRKTSEYRLEFFPHTGDMMMVGAYTGIISEAAELMQIDGMTYSSSPAQDFWEFLVTRGMHGSRILHYSDPFTTHRANLAPPHFWEASMMLGAERTRVQGNNLDLGRGEYGYEKQNIIFERGGPTDRTWAIKPEFPPPEGDDIPPQKAPGGGYIDQEGNPITP